MAQHLPKPRTKKLPREAVGLDGLAVSVSNAAISGVEKSKQVKGGGLAGLTSKVSVKQLCEELGNEGLRQAAIDAGRTPPSAPTLRRWAQLGRIPHADVLECAQRRVAIERLGGIDAVAAKIGCSRSAISRYRSGEMNALRADASKKLENVKVEDIMKRAGVLGPDGMPKKAVVRVKGGVEVRNGAGDGYDYRVRTLDFANSDTPFSGDDSRKLAAALADDDHARVVAILERHATLDYPASKGFDTYSDQFGFHFDHIESVHIDWI
ncbi:hypothetical protein ACNJ7E_30150 [Rhodococcus sp. NM-2]|uniref:hypothetical protein n=1 Tax=Rhodococcus sp. NM-2 TaxID=3401174 RepID=UPI003AB0B198